MSDENMESIPSRVNLLEQETHTLKYQLTELRALQPRVGEMENQVAILNTKLGHIENTTAEIKHGMGQMSAEQKEYFEKLMSEQATANGRFNGFASWVKIGGTLFALGVAGAAFMLWALAQ